MLIVRFGGRLGRPRDPSVTAPVARYTQDRAMIFVFEPVRDGYEVTSRTLQVQPKDVGHGQS